MKLVNFLKKNVPLLPYSLGNVIAHVPYAWRPGLGKVYSLRRAEIGEIHGYNTKQQHDFVFQRVRKLAIHAYQNIKFYTHHYQKNGFSPNDLKDFDSIKRIPIVAKRDLMEFDLDDRCDMTQPNRTLANTGGSTGVPLSFYIQNDSFGHEKAHMNFVWEKLGFQQSDSVLTFSGRSKLKNAIQYDGLRHSFLVDIYQPFEKTVSACDELFRRKRMPEYLHGYPSAIYDFLSQISKKNMPLALKLRKSIKGVFLGSEYPNPRWRKKIETIVDAPSVSWYGHTERCVLAYEAEEAFSYHPLLSYGYAESIPNSSGEQLVGTSYYNFSSPFIRYNTEDGIKATAVENGILKRFEIVDGRDGEYILDRYGKKIPLTGLIYGRHHKLFDYCRSIQLSQKTNGVANIHYCVLDNVQLPGSVERLFDSTNVEIEFFFKDCIEPIRTKSGKVGLLIKSTSS